MFKNEILRISREEAARIVEENKTTPSIHLVELEGKGLQSWEGYVSVIEKAYEFPEETSIVMEGYDDWMTDLDWLGKEGYILMIYDYKEFLTKNPRLKEEIMDGFETMILPWWQSDVEKFSVGGKAKPFTVYLID